MLPDCGHEIRRFLDSAPPTFPTRFLIVAATLVKVVLVLAGASVTMPKVHGYLIKNVLVDRPGDLVTIKENGAFRKMT